MHIQPDSRGYDCPPCPARSGNAPRRPAPAPARVALLLAFLLAISLFRATISAAAPIDLSHRIVVESTWDAGARRGTIAAPAAGFDPHRTGFALLVRGWAGAALPPSIPEFGTSPVRRADGWLFPLPYGHLHPGATTTFTLVEPEGNPAPGAFPPANPPVLFSLRDSFEEAHFEQAFHDPDAARAAAFFSKGTAGIPVRTAQPPTDPAQDRVDMEHYDLTLSLNMANTTVSGVVIARGLVVSGPLTQVVLDFVPNSGAMTVSSVVDADSAAALAFSVDSAANRLRITLPAALQTGERFGVKVAYGGTPSTSGQYGAPYRRSTHNGTPLIFTFSQPYGARQWWPCKDIPGDKATIDLHIDAPSAYTVVSNGVLVAKTDIGGGRNRFDYSMRYPVATYLVSVTCTNYVFGSTTYTALDGDTTMTVGHFVYPENARELSGVAGTLKALQLFAQTFGEYPFLTDKYVTSTHGSGSGMEHQTCTSMPAGNLYPDGKHRRNIHELAHQWFGDSVTCETYDHVWLNEGFASWCEAYFYEQDAGPAAYFQYMQDFDNSGITDTEPLSGSNADAMTQSNVYRKGAWVVHMLRGIIGDEKFFPGIRSYLATHRHGNANSAQFQAAMEAVHGQPLDWFFNQWVYNPGRPAFSVAWNLAPAPAPDTGSVVSLTLTQTQSGAVFRVPMTVAIETLSGELLEFPIDNTVSPQTFALPVGDDLPVSVVIDPSNWVLKTVAVPGAPAAPLALNLVAATAPTPGLMSATLEWEHAGGAILAGFEVFTSPDLATWTRAADGTTLAADARSWTAHVDSSRPIYVRVRAIASDGSPSLFSNTFATWTGSTGDPASNDSGALIVDAFSRWTLDRDVPHSFVATHAAAFRALGMAFDSCASKRPAASGAIVLSRYAMVDWLCGEEASATESVSTAEQAQLTTYLQAGGRLFITGSEIAFDLSNGSTADRNFLRNSLGATYDIDDTVDRTASGIAGGPFEGMSFRFGDGGDGTYRVRTPDSIVAGIAAAGAVLRHGQSTYTAGVAHKATLSGGTAPAAVVYLTPPFESVYPVATRVELLRRSLIWMGFTLAPPDAAQGWVAQ